MSLMENCSNQRDILVLDPESKPPELPGSTQNLTEDSGMVEDLKDTFDVAPGSTMPEPLKDVHVNTPKELSIEAPKEKELPTEVPIEVPKEVDAVSIGQERKKPVVKIRLRQSSAASRADTDDQMVERSMGIHNGVDRAASSSVSVDAPPRNFGEAPINHNVEEVNSWHDHGSRLTASIGSAKFLGDGDELVKELQCTADSSVVFSPRPLDPSSSSIIQDNNVDADARRFVSLQSLSVADSLAGDVSLHGKEKKKKKEKKRKHEDHKRHRDDPEYLERKRLKKEKKRKEKEMAKVQGDEAKNPAVEFSSKKEPTESELATQEPKPIEPSSSKADASRVDVKPEAASEGTSAAPKFRIKIKNRVISKS